MPFSDELVGCLVGGCGQAIYYSKVVSPHTCTQAATDVGCHRIVIIAIVRPALQIAKEHGTPGVVASTGPGRRVAGRTDGTQKAKEADGWPLVPWMATQPNKQTKGAASWHCSMVPCVMSIIEFYLASWILLMHVLLCTYM